MNNQANPVGRKRSQSNVFTIAPGDDFLHTLVNALLDGTLIRGFEPAENPILLPDVTVYVPNRRAARALSSAFLARFEGSATLLPKIRTLGDTDEDEFGISVDAAEFTDLPPAINSVDRTLQLAMLVQSWKDRLAFNIQELFGDETILIPTSAADSLRLAEDLANLLTQMTQEEINWDTVKQLVPEDHADWWRLTSEFLQIIMTYWPQYLRENKLSDPAMRAVTLLKARADRYRDNPTSGPVIVAGTTGSVPSTQLLLKSVAQLDDGAIVLPGVDLTMSDAAWARLTSSSLTDDPLIEAHPQFGLARTLNFLGVDRTSVKELGHVSAKAVLRHKVVSTALSLSDLSADWHLELEETTGQERSDAFQNVALLEAVNERQEALAIAIAMRESLENEVANAALVTPDRNLAQRVSMELLRFGIKVDDSAGVPLANTETGIFLRGLAKVIQQKPGHPEIAAFLKNPLCLADIEPEKSELYSQVFEQVCLRGSIHTPVAGKYALFLEQKREKIQGDLRLPLHIKAIEEDVWDGLSDWLSTIDSCLANLTEAHEKAALVPLHETFALLRNAAVKLATGADGICALSDVRGSNELDTFIQDLITGRSQSHMVLPEELPDVLDALLAGKVCRTGSATHPRLHIYGPLEVRLLKYDRVILAGLNEDTWPQNNRSDAFLNRTLRRQLNMPSPERRTGLAAHDFQQLMGASEVILSRAGRVDKSPTVASRWLQRLQAFLGATLSAQLKERGNRYLAYSTALDVSESRGSRAKRPNETPPVKSRPKGLPVTDIETWIRDPYALYAKRILKLIPIDPLEREPDALLRGILYHAIMEAYVRDGGPQKPVHERLAFLMQIATEKLDQENLASDIKIIWQLRFKEIAKAYLEWEAYYQDQTATNKTLTEIDGSIQLGEAGFNLRARADRIDVLEDGTINLFDYKTGGSPSKEQARTLSPQLALEALIAERGGFDGLSNVSVSEMKYLRLRVGEEIGKEKIADAKNPLADIVAKAEKNLEAVIAAYSHPDQGYISRHAPFKDSEMSGDYDHLARVREWSFGEEDGDE